tara:strand:+ start:173 stop:607 length:435 start_codon:yes stop_codon:yes gene_type:complete
MCSKNKLSVAFLVGNIVFFSECTEARQNSRDFPEIVSDANSIDKKEYFPEETHLDLLAEPASEQNSLDPSIIDAWNSDDDDDDDDEPDDNSLKDNDEPDLSSTHIRNIRQIPKFPGIIDSLASATSYIKELFSRRISSAAPKTE